MSIPSNIAEGYRRKTTVDYIRMLYISYGSVCELETQILLAGDLGFIEKGELVTAQKNIAEGYGRKTTVDYIRMLYISYGSVCELETQVLLAGDLGFIEKGELDTIKRGIAEIERMLKSLIKSLENKPLNP